MDETSAIPSLIGRRISNLSERAIRKCIYWRRKLAFMQIAGLARSCYKETWERLSCDETQAKLSVAGTANDEEFWISGVSTANTMKEMLRITEADTVLEIGCGVGRIGKYLAPHCKSWIGTDISGRMLRYARKNLADQDNVFFVELNNSTLKEVESQSVDAVYCSAVLMHLDEWERYKYIKEAFRILRPGGRAYFDNLNLAGELGWKIFTELLNHQEGYRPPHISKMSTATELKVYFERAGFSDIKTFPGDHFVAAVGIKSLQ